MMRRQAGCDGIMMTDWKRKISHVERFPSCLAIFYAIGDDRNCENSRLDYVPLIVNMPESAYYAV